MHWQPVIHFWFHELTFKDWFSKNQPLDDTICRRYGVLHGHAAQGELYQWRSSPIGRLAEIIVLDQFSRNIYRDDPRAFAQDQMALALAQEAIAHRLDRNFSTAQKMFLYMPFMHSESKLIHAKAVQLFSTPGLENNLDYEMRHKEIIDRFGRYPHRNKVLGRVSSPEELRFLKDPKNSF